MLNRREWFAYLVAALAGGSAGYCRNKPAQPSPTLCFTGTITGGPIQDGTVPRIYFENGVVVAVDRVSFVPTSVRVLA